MVRVWLSLQSVQLATSTTLACVTHALPATGSTATKVVLMPPTPADNAQQASRLPPLEPLELTGQQPAQVRCIEQRVGPLMRPSHQWPRRGQHLGLRGRGGLSGCEARNIFGL
jgi:hypothetical protein